MVAKRMVGLPGDLGYRTDADGYPVNRQFTDVPQDKPEIHAEPGFEGQVHAFNMFALCFPFRRDVESFGGFLRPRQPVLRHDRRARAADHARQRSRRVVHSGYAMRSSGTSTTAKPAGRARRSR